MPVDRTAMSLIARIQSAKVALTEAEANLEKAISEIRSAPRSEKVTISESLEHAFDTLRVARSELAEVESLIARGDTESTPDVT